MATLKFKDIKGMGNEEREKKLKELKLELVKSKAGANKAGSSKIKQIKKIIARILMINSKHGNMSKVWLA
ncbi:50S ribosomal protein L29 [Candidatus Pacearchaeota archaeon RBG_16_35_8]|uniref:Large ribosomal subunit protein uL29 n=1 Tax=uncultured archaeon Rifle_16ft_4_minimus_1461 TaxID=1665151 RepID=A0A0H4T3X6_9ARCH|nr:hypothetical protein [uncultured archaeon Rifle_16ft_4_minimus_1461]OGJ12335.1 MAG: 50S ribosomal protein L29 [Candidatus Pacearchaeota archaeon RBG_16_35_8]